MQCDRKQLTEELVKEVLARLSVCADVKNAVQNIEALNNAIKNLGK